MSEWIALDTDKHGLEPENTIVLPDSVDAVYGAGLRLWFEVVDVDGCRIKVKPLDRHKCWQEARKCLDVFKEIGLIDE